MIYPRLVAALTHHCSGDDLHWMIVYPILVVVLACRYLGSRFDGLIVQRESLPMVVMLACPHLGSCSDALIAQGGSRLAVVVAQAAGGCRWVLRS